MTGQSPHDAPRRHVRPRSQYAEPVRADAALMQGDVMVIQTPLGFPRFRLPEHVEGQLLACLLRRDAMRER